MDNRFEEVLISSNCIYTGRLLTLREDTIQLPSGLIAKREIVEHHHAVVVLPVTDHGEIVLVQQFRRAAERVMLEVPAGLINPGESPLAAAHRELGEETGYHAAKMTPLFAGFPTPGFCTEYMHFFLATGLTMGHANPDEDEIVATLHMSISEIKEAIQNHGIVDVKTVAAFGWYCATR